MITSTKDEEAYNHVETDLWVRIGRVATEIVVFGGRDEAFGNVNRDDWKKDEGEAIACLAGLGMFVESRAMFLSPEVVETPLFRSSLKIDRGGATGR